MALVLKEMVEASAFVATGSRLHRVFACTRLPQACIGAQAASRGCVLWTLEDAKASPDAQAAVAEAERLWRWCLSAGQVGRGRDRGSHASDEEGRGERRGANHEWLAVAKGLMHVYP